MAWIASLCNQNVEILSEFEHMSSSIGVFDGYANMPPGVKRDFNVTLGISEHKINLSRIPFKNYGMNQ